MLIRNALYFIALTFTGLFLLFYNTVTPSDKPATMSTLPIVIYEPDSIQNSLIQFFIQRANPDLRMAQSAAITREIIRQSDIHDFDPFFLTSLIATESAFRPAAVSGARAKGLMQLSADVIALLRVRDPFNIQQNIQAGTGYLAYLRQRFNHPQLMLAAYNAGPTRIARLKRVPRIAETLSYIRKIDLYQGYLRAYFRQTMQTLKVKPVLYASLIGAHGMQLRRLSSIVRPNLVHSLAPLDICEQRRPRFLTLLSA